MSSQMQPDTGGKVVFKRVTGLKDS